MRENERLLEAWDQLVKTIAEKQGLSSEQAVLHVRKHFPELYELYKKARQEKKVNPSK